MLDEKNVCRNDTIELKIKKSKYFIKYDISEAICYKKKQLRFKKIIEYIKS